MKKFWIWLIPLICAAMISVGVVIGVTADKNLNSKVVFATNLYCRYDKLSLYVENTYTITSNEIVVEPKNCTQKILFNTDNENMLSVDAITGEILTKEVGNCNLIATVKASEVENITIKIPVEVKEIVIDAPDEEEIVINKNEYTINKTIDLNIGTEMIIYQTESSKNECSYTVLSGEDCVDEIVFDYKKIYVSAKAVGEIEILIDSPTDQTIIYITVFES